MTPDDRKKLRDLIVGEESYRQFPYNDTTGHVTIGIGRNLTDRGVSFEESLQMLDNDVIYFTHRLDLNLDFFKDLNAARQMVLISMCFNLGLLGLLGFKKMIASLEQKDYNEASKEILNSKASEETGKRYEILAEIMRTGEYVF
jgi:lysozyme